MASKGGVIVVVSGEDKTGEVFAAVKKHLDETQAAAKETSGSLGKIGEVLQSGLQAAGIYVGLREIVGGLKGMVTSTMEAGVQINKLRQETGITAANLSVLKYAAGASGVEFEVVAKAGKKLAEAIHDTDTGKLAEGFKILGITAGQVRSQGSDMYGVMELIADKFASMPDGPEKLAAAVKLFGRSGQEIIPILNQGSAALEKMRAEAPIFSEEDLNRMEKMEHSVNDLDAAWKRLSLTFTEVVATPLTSYLNNLAGGIDIILGKVREIRGGLSNEEQATADAYAKQYQAGHPDWAGKPPKPAPVAPTAEEIAKQQRLAAELAAAQERADAALLQLREAGAKQDETMAKIQASTLLEINEEQHKQGLMEDGRYLREKATLQNSAFNAELASLEAQQSAISGRMAELSAKAPKTEAARLDNQVKLNALQRELMAIEDKLAELDERRAKAAREVAAEYKAAYESVDAIISLPDDSGAAMLDALKSKAPNVKLDPLSENIENEGEKLAHGLFDPLFDFGEKWNKQWKQIRANMLKDAGQFAESQLFGVLFGDSSGKGGKGWVGGQGDSARKGVSGVGGLLGQGVDWLEGIGKKGASSVSNGTGAAGAGTVTPSIASALQIGKGGAGASGSIQVIIQNLGTPATVDSTQQSSGIDLEHTVLNIVLKDITTNGQVGQAISSM